MVKPSLLKKKLLSSCCLSFFLLSPSVSGEEERRSDRTCTTTMTTSTASLSLISALASPQFQSFQETLGITDTQPLTANSFLEFSDYFTKEIPLFPPQAKTNSIVRCFLDPASDEKIKQSILTILLAEAFHEDSHDSCQETFYQVLRLQSRTSEKKEEYQNQADRIITLGLDQGRNWAYLQALSENKALASKKLLQRDLSPYHLKYANKDIKEAIEILNKQYEYTSGYFNNFVDKCVDLKLKNKISILEKNIKSYIQKWVDIGYHVPLSDILSCNISLSSQEKILTPLLTKQLNDEMALMGRHFSEQKHADQLIKHPEKAFEWYLKAVKGGNKEVMYNLAIHYEKGLNNQERNLPKAFRWYLKAAEAGHIEAIYRAALFLECGFNEQTPDLANAFKLYRKAAHLGHIESMYSLFTFLYKDIGNEKPTEFDAFEWCRKAANSNHIKAMYNLGAFYYKGFPGLSKDLSQSIKWYRKAANADDIDAMSTLGSMLTGNTKSIKEGISWIKKAAHNGHIIAMHNLGFYYNKGFLDQKPDSVKAQKWFHKAAKKGRTESMIALFLHYTSINDAENAYFWLKEAKERNNEQAIQLFDRYLLQASAEALPENEEAVPFQLLTRKLDSDQDEMTQEEEKFLNSFIEQSEQAALEIISLSGISQPAHNEKEEIQLKIVSDSDEETESAKSTVGLELVSVSEEEQPATSLTSSSIKNPKHLREQLKKTAHVGRQIEQNIARSLEHIQSIKAQSILKDLLSSSTCHKIDVKDLVVLFKDPFFENKVSIGQTAQGYKITAQGNSGHPVSVSTHRPHTKKYKGFDPAFYSSIQKKILSIFGLGINSLYTKSI